MRAPADKLPAFVGTEVDNAGYLVAQILATKIGEAGSAEQRDGRNRILAQQAAAADEIAYAEGLKARHNVKILNSDFQKPTGKPAEAGKAAPQGEAKK
jgi:peptidyl-prolyl cis-trans isomerase D